MNYMQVRLNAKNAQLLKIAEEKPITQHEIQQASLKLENMESFKNKTIQHRTRSLDDEKDLLKQMLTEMKVNLSPTGSMSSSSSLQEMKRSL